MTARMARRLAILIVCYAYAFATAFVKAECPSRCTCQSSVSAFNQPIFTTNCAGRQFDRIPDVALDARTTFLDLRHNRIGRLPKDAFNQLRNLSVLLLGDNRIDTIEPFALRGLKHLTLVNLRRNRLTIIDSDALSGISGHQRLCKGGGCVIDISENPITNVKKYALAWVKSLSIKIGTINTSKSLTIHPYAFYGVRDIPKIRIQDVSNLAIEPRSFTNAENVSSVIISNSTLPHLPAFTFEGLSDTNAIIFDNCRILKMAPYAFSGIHYLSSPALAWNITPLQPPVLLGSSPHLNIDTVTYRVARPETQAKFTGGGLVNFTSCQIRSLPTNAFCDTNLVNIILSKSSVGRVDSLAFADLPSLQSLFIVDNNLTNLSPKCFGQLQRVRHVIIHNNDLNELPKHAFYDSRDITHLSIHLKQRSHLSLQALVFSSVTDVADFEIVGGLESSIVLNADTFGDMFGVGRLRIVNTSIPVVQANAFRGLRSVTDLTLLSCGVGGIDGKAFGSNGGVGAIAKLNISTGNKLACNCNLARTLVEIQRTVMHCSVVCAQDGRYRSISADEFYQAPCYNNASPSLRALAIVTFVSFFISLI